MNNANRQVTVLGLGAIGQTVARSLSEGLIPNMSLHSVAASSRESAQRRISAFPRSPKIVDLGDLDDYGEVVVECLPPVLFLDAALPVVSSGRTLVAASVGGLLNHPEVVEQARAAGGRILLPSGAMGGLDAVRALAEMAPDHVELVSEKPLAAFEQNPCLTEAGIEFAAIREPVCLFDGSAAEGIRHFPKNVNVVAALALAGIGAQQTRLKLWAVPGISVNRHTVRVRTRYSSLEARMENLPDPDNPRTSAVTARSVVACLKNAFGAVSFC